MWEERQACPEAAASDPSSQEEQKLVVNAFPCAGLRETSLAPAIVGKPKGV